MRSVGILSNLGKFLGQKVTTPRGDGVLISVECNANQSLYFDDTATCDVWFRGQAIVRAKWLAKDVIRWNTIIGAKEPENLEELLSIDLDEDDDEPEDRSNKTTERLKPDK